MTKAFSIYDDMWMMSWMEDGADACLVKSTVPQALWAVLQNSPEVAAHAAGNLVIDPSLVAVADFAAHAHNHGVQNPSITEYGWDKKLEELLGKEALFHLTHTEDVGGFIKCNLGNVDLKETGNVPIDIEIHDDEVIFKLYGKTCTAKVIEQCRQTETCMHKPICQNA
mmetsp:Transcript_82155/g.156043  ORF Transcript_82155/g.156043 Transcript_82155/m.156043 type:complete len:168 (+) Transcript_82155:841-1344(+)